MQISSLLLAGLAAASLQTAPLAAETVSLPVSYHGLDLRSDSGLKVVNRRIRNAADQICGDPWTRDLAMLRAIRRCAQETLADARPKLARVVAAQRDIRTAQVQ